MKETIIDDLIKKLMTSNPDYTKVAERLQNQILQTAIASQDSFYAYTAAKEFFYDFFQKPQIAEFTVYFNKWKELGSALICQAIADKNIKIPGIKFNYDLIDSDVESYTKELYRNLYLSYAKRYVECQFLDIYAQLLPVKKEAADKYIKKLKLSVPLHEIWYSYHEWNSPKNELFHHYAKILGLGQSEETIDDLITNLKGLGLTVPKAVDVIEWKSYKGYLNNDEFLTAKNLKELACNSLRKDYHPLEIHYPDKMFPLLFVLCQKRYIIEPQIKNK